MPIASAGVHTQDFCLNSEIVRSLVLDARSCSAHNNLQLWREWYSYSVGRCIIIVHVRKNYMSMQIVM